MSRLGSYPSRVKTLDLINRKYQQLEISIAVQLYYNACLLYNKTKTLRLLLARFLKLLLVLLALQQDILVNYIILLLPCKRRGQTFYNVIVVVNRLIKIQHFIPTMSIEAEELAKRFIKRVYSLYSILETVVSNRGIQFISAFQRTLLA